MNTVSKRLKLNVANVLQQADSPMRTSEIAEILGKSHTSVKAALTAIGAEQVPDIYPAEWRISDEGLAPVTAITAATPRVGESRGRDFIVSAPDMEPADLVANWNQNHKKFGERIGEMVVGEDVDPKELAEQLGNFAGAIAGLAAVLSEVADRPDWLDSLS